MSNIKIYTVFKDTDREFTGNYKEISEHFKISCGTFRGRLNYGYTPEEAIDWNGGKSDRRPMTVFKDTDREFTGNRRQIAEHFGISYETFRGRLKRGYAPEEAIDWNGRKHDQKPMTVFKGTNREFTGNQSEIAKHFEIGYITFNYRLRQGYTPEEAIDIPLEKVRQNKLKYKNCEGDMRELCRMFNKNYIEVYNKVQYNHTFEWAMDSTKTLYEE